MKKIILSLALLAGFAGAANAQTGLKLGLKGGVNLANYSGTDSKDFNYKYGFTAGGLINYGFSDMLSVQGELLYSQKGFNTSDVPLSAVNGTAGTSTANIKQTLQYIDVPILFKVNTGEDGKGFFFEVGPQGSFVIANRVFSDDNALSGKTSVTFKNTGRSVNIGTSTDEFNKVTIGYVGGIGYQLTSGLGLGVRYTGDISQVYKDNGTTKPNVRNGVFQFQVHYLFGGKG